MNSEIEAEISLMPGMKELRLNEPLFNERMVIKPERKNE